MRGEFFKMYGAEWRNQPVVFLDLAGFYCCFRQQANRAVFAIRTGQEPGGEHDIKELVNFLASFRSVLVEQGKNEVANLDSLLPEAELVLIKNELPGVAMAVFA